MAATGASSVKVHRHTRGFMPLLTSAVCEWFLIFLLFLDAVLCYLLTKFASYCNLETPCLLCSRLDNILGSEKLESYRTLLCSIHKSEISSLIHCQIHDKLVDSHGMCEDCLLSFVTNNKGISESKRFLGAKLGFDLNSSTFQNPFMNRDLVYGSNETRPCSCCNKLWSSNQHAQMFFQLKSTGSGSSKPNIPLPRFPGRNRLNRRESLKRMRAKFYGSVTSQRIGSSGIVPLSEVGYSELKITSDSESEVPFSDDDDGSIMAVSIQRDSIVLPECKCGRLVSVQVDQQSVNSSPLILEPLVQCDDNESHDEKCSASDVSIGHGLSELNWEQADHDFNRRTLPELMTFDDVPSSINIMEATDGSLPKYSTKLDYAEPSMNKEISRSTNGELKSAQVSDNLITSKPEYPDPCISSKSDVNNMEKEASTSLAQQYAQGVDFSLNNSSPRAQFHHDELQNTGGFSSNGATAFHKSDSFDRDESALESLDGSTVSDIDGESVVDRLKRQVEYDRKGMTSLYKELEEERNASAVAANQAMAMITRLQEEKAALHMEALQYLRMMEEQAEYDVDALQKANDLLAEKEKELQDYEAELEMYRNQYAVDLMVETLPENSCNSVKSVASEPLKEVDKPCDSNKSSWLNFEDEKMYITECLKNLEMKLHGVSGNGASMHMPNGEYHENETNGKNNNDKFLDDEITQIDHSMEENGVSTPKSFSGFNGSPLSQGGCIASADSDREKSCIHFRETNLVAIENEVSELNYRLEALEESRDFLEHALNTLQNGKEGLYFIQEISHHLQELRKIGLKQRSQLVP